MPLTSTNPVTGQAIASYSELETSELLSILGEAQRAGHGWGRTPLAERVRVLRTAAEILRRDAASLARTAALEMGKPVRDGSAEAQKCALVCDHYAEHGEGYLRPESVFEGPTRGHVVFRPLGVILGIMPWNYPFWQVFRFAAPALMAGNAAVLKHASNVTGCALAIERIFLEAGLPPGVFRSLLISTAAIPTVIAHPAVQGVALTGSTAAGISVGRLAGEALKKVVLELGGSDPYVILADADLEKAAVSCATSRLLNNGQSCISAKRFIVVDSVRPRFEELLRAEMATFTPGDPLDEAVRLGPLVRRSAADEIHQQVSQSVQRGARCLLGGQRTDPKSAFYAPTILTDVRPGMPAYDDEIFGPVAAVISVSDEAEAIRVANDTSFGLGAAVFTRDLEKGFRIAAEELNAGACAVNDYVRSDPRLPFGGIKASGHGRELSYYGLREFVNIKSVTVSTAG